MYKLVFTLIVLFFSGCATRDTLAPVIEGKWRSHKPSPSKHSIQRGETLYAVAFRYDKDYRQLIALNHLTSPYHVKVGQVIRIDSHSNRSLEIKTSRNRKIKTPRSLKSPSSPDAHTKKYLFADRSPIKLNHFNYSRPWQWPIRGQIITRFTPQLGKKGIDIAGRKGQMIHAASSGIVAYSGNGLVGYGNLIIIRHNNQFLTAYGNNLRNLIKEGQKVNAGQIIAEIGLINRQTWGVHFEIRKVGIPVNPLHYLPM